VLWNTYADILLLEFQLLNSQRILFNAFHDLIWLFQVTLGEYAEALRLQNSSLRGHLEQTRKAYEQIVSENASLLRIRKEYEQLLSQNASLKVSFVCYLYIVISYYQSWWLRFSAMLDHLLNYAETGNIVGTCCCALNYCAYC
jgi:hypothetical protein